MGSRGAGQWQHGKATSRYHGYGLNQAASARRRCCGRERVQACPACCGPPHLWPLPQLQATRVVAVPPLLVARCRVRGRGRGRCCLHDDGVVLLIVAAQHSLSARVVRARWGRGMWCSTRYLIACVGGRVVVGPHTRARTG